MRDLLTTLWAALNMILIILIPEVNPSTPTSVTGKSSSQLGWTSKTKKLLKNLSTLKRDNNSLEPLLELLITTKPMLLDLRPKQLLLRSLLTQTQLDGKASTLTCKKELIDSQ